MPNHPLNSADLDAIVEEIIAHAVAADKAKKPREADIWRNAARIISRKRHHARRIPSLR